MGQFHILQVNESVAHRIRDALRNCAVIEIVPSSLFNSGSQLVIKNNRHSAVVAFAIASISHGRLRRGGNSGISIQREVPSVATF